MQYICPYGTYIYYHMPIKSRNSVCLASPHHPSAFNSYRIIMTGSVSDGENEYNPPKTSNFVCFQDGSSMVVLPYFPGVQLFYTLGGYYILFSGSYSQMLRKFLTTWTSAKVSQICWVLRLCSVGSDTTCQKVVVLTFSNWPQYWKLPLLDITSLYTHILVRCF